MNYSLTKKLMVKKRKYHFVYSNNTDEEEYLVRKDFTKMIREFLVKEWKTLVNFIFLITIITIIAFIYSTEIKQYIDYLYEILNIRYYLSIFQSILHTKYGIIISIWIMIALLYQIVTQSKWKK